jgi:hypothetical protein
MAQDEKGGQSGGKYFDDGASHFIFYQNPMSRRKRMAHYAVAMSHFISLHSQAYWLTSLRKVCFPLRGMLAEPCPRVPGTIIQTIGEFRLVVLSTATVGLAVQFSSTLALLTEPSASRPGLTATTVSVPAPTLELALKFGFELAGL